MLATFFLIFTSITMGYELGLDAPVSQTQQTVVETQH